MKHSIIKYSIWCLSFIMAGSFMACKKDYVDPSRATDDKVFLSPTGLTAVSIGLQRYYALGRGGTLYNLITTDALVTKQVFVLNQGNLAEFQVQTGGTTLDGTNSMIASFWTVCNKVVYDADRVIAGAQNLPDKNYASGLI